MSLQGTWADHIVIQAVADAMNLKIHIIESDEKFGDTTIVEPVNAIQSTISILIGHIGEIHYVSTSSALCRQNSQQSINCTKTDTASEKLVKNPLVTKQVVEISKAT